MIKLIDLIDSETLKEIEFNEKNPPNSPIDANCKINRKELKKFNDKYNKEMKKKIKEKLKKLK